jgi:VWFA-related protein
MRASRRVAAVLAGWLVALGAAAQDVGVGSGASTLTVPAGGSGRVLDDATVERLLRVQDEEQVTVRSILLPAAVEDAKGRIVRGLTADDFRVLENKVPQIIDFFSIEGDEPISVAFLLDLSGSMRNSGKLLAAKEAIRYFLDNLRPSDRFALVGFADEQVSWITEFTSDRDRFLERLDVQEGFGQTALHDAVAATPALVDRAVVGRKAIVLITDGVDNASRLSEFEAIGVAREVEVPIYAVGFSALSSAIRDERAPSNDERVLRRFAKETGGAAFVVNDPDELKEAVVRINGELRYQYLIGYRPSHDDWDGSFRQIRVQTRAGRYTVRTRTGYYANP